jgi:hypothetical protein
MQPEIKKSAAIRSLNQEEDMKYADIDRIYRNVPLDKIPWNNETPPDQLVELVESGKVWPAG